MQQDKCKNIFPVSSYRRTGPVGARDRAMEDNVKVEVQRATYCCSSFLDRHAKERRREGGRMEGRQWVRGRERRKKIGKENGREVGGGRETEREGEWERGRMVGRLREREREQRTEGGR